jgi:hypothetical protein
MLEHQERLHGEVERLLIDHGPIVPLHHSGALTAIRPAA